MEEFHSAVIEILEANPRDAPFTFLYEVDTAAENEQTTVVSSFDAQGDRNKAVSLKLAGTVGVPDDHPSVPAKLTLELSPKGSDAWSYRHDLRNSISSVTSHGSSGSLTQRSYSEASIPEDASNDWSSGLQARSVPSWPIAEALSTRRMVMVEDCRELIEGYTVRVWDELPTSAIVVPITNDMDEGVPSAVFVIGLNVRRPFDEEYQSFIQL